jgi:phosphohistidine phosphatase
MKTIYIVRHAKSSWNHPDLSDEQRPLMEKGKKRTKKVIEFLLKNEVKVDCILSSHAVRAHETAKILAAGLDYPVDGIKVDPRIYFASGDSLIDHFFGLPANDNSVMLVGHNPTLTDFVNQFLAQPIDNLPTSGVISISFDTQNWEQIPLAKKKINFILFPKEMED